MTWKNGLKWTLILTLLIMVMAGCGNSPSATSHLASDNEKTDIQEGTKTNKPFLTFKDDSDRTVTLENKPERIIILNNEMTELFYQLGGEAVGIATSPGVDIPEKAANVQQVGIISSVNMEQIMKLKPDLLIGQPLFHQKLADTFTDAGIPFAILTIDSIEGIRENARLLGKILDKEQDADLAVDSMNAQLQSLTRSLPSDEPTYAIITLMANNISLQKQSSIALDIAGLLKMKNVAESLPSGKMPSSVPFSMEKLAELDPDYLFIVVHGSSEDGQRMIQQQLESNPAWSSLKAVKSGNLQILPPSMFVTSPGIKITDSVKYMEKLVYPKVEAGNE
ncbi:iron compound ABC transporter iron compound-binding protein [Paenibacillus sp. J23TS9]|uniref:ABC transporter substrate-binding protein n=1 Tax=Paenibacillus sp. J23TS9 TaxID=2807193 RepID=UPI001B00E56E|nr:ABC transporter substrate-binding protein [Paenibacillus sp. J23TS9]GIP26138.1 iron compound ABC transporter iron compound-binding protein [Paenibacillus sp. J23TS9]